MCARVPSAERALCISIHDVAPATWPACARLLAMLDALGPVRITLLIVPDFHHRGRIDADASFVRAIDARLARGDEAALHGYYHLDDVAARNPTAWFWRRLYTAKEGEFAALDVSAAGERLQRGRRLLENLGWRIDGFVAPAWLLGEGARQALSLSEFRYTATWHGLHRLPDWSFTPSPSLVYSTRSAWRRTLSHLWNAALACSLQSRPLLRVSLHPGDADHPRVVQRWRILIEHALRDRRSLTKREWIDTLHASAPLAVSDHP